MFCEEKTNKGEKIICVDNLYTGRLENISQFIKNPQYFFFNSDIIEINTYIKLTNLEFNFGGFTQNDNSKIIYLLVNRDFEGYGIWSMMWFFLACIIYFLLVRFYDCEKKISKISQKSKYSKCISHILSAFITLFAIWLWIFYGLEFIYSIINA